MEKQIKLSEGDLVLWDRSNERLPNEVVEIYNITRTTIRVYTDIEGLDEVQLNRSSIKPIPITEEWLVRFGFKINSGVSSREFLMKNIKVCNHYEKGFLFIVDWWHSGIMIQSVHQLQNLYFALTGEELILKS